MSPNTIWVVDDSATIRLMLDKFYRELGYRVVLMKDGLEAITAVESGNKPDLMLLDVDMPGMNGFDVCRIIRQHHDQPPTLPIIMLTSSDDEADIERAFALGVDEYLLKPVNWSLLKQRTRLLLERRQAVRGQQSSQQWLAALFSTAVDAIVVFDEDGIILDVNPALERLFGYVRAVMIGQGIQLLLPTAPSGPESVVQTPSVDQITASSGSGQEVKARHRDGNHFIVQLAVSRVESEDGESRFFAIIHDLTEQKMLQKALMARNEEMLRERSIVADILDRMRAHSTNDVTGVFTIFHPMERASGDILIAATRPTGVRHVFLGDFTGHGLTAALAGPMVTDIFCTMTNKGFAPDQILTEMNRQLHVKLPTTLFLAASFIEYDPAQKRLFIWNGGNPPLFLLRNDGSVRTFPSHTLSLGIVGGQSFDAQGCTLHVEEGEQVVAYTDGITEVAAQHSVDMFGEDRVVELFQRADSLEEVKDLLLKELCAFSGSEVMDDDLSMVIVQC
ncbi:putative PAS/PAC sensor protein [Magnetococcus marinus MC-1]|uniref:Putative PAS/PAC sensor protein n=1 Tax=Magnetococcus marinus (strain ATCC BAA-1437 / JCM 17883 / MC-1) TaxID=156889 RepID=A0L8E1_MAGMM|nr:SpoIIE family protein phosphatase [Magnetococcus marinus]ABK44234.1 putative PAS/PAC sensor protein [Magnetococcus marinus MC-1]